MKRISWRKQTYLVSREAYLVRERSEAPSPLHSSRTTLHEPRFTNDGFSLIEVIGVIAIITIIAAVLAPNLINRLDAAARNAELESLDGMAQAIEVYLRENHTWPPDLASLSPDYLPTNTLQLTQNDGGFPRYFFVHPGISGISNATGLDVTELDDAQFLIISNLNADAAPTITNAAEFDAWWNTDETTTPDLKIHRGQVSNLFSLLTLEATGSRGDYQIDGTTTNWDCHTKPELDHNKYHLTGTTVALDEVSPYGTPEVQFSVAKDISYRYDPCHAAGSRWRTTPSANPECWSLWLTTNQDVASSGTPCLDTWADGEFVQVGNPDLAFEPGTTSGTFSSVVNMEGFVQDGNMGTLGAIDYVRSNITVGTITSIDLLAGDLLFAHHVTSETFINLPIGTDNWQLLMFRPDAPGDYSAGTVSLLLFEPTGGHVHSVSLVETDTVVGDTTLQAGTFLLSKSGPGKNDILHFSPTRVGGTTTGTLSTLLNGSALGIGNNNEVQGLDLIETTLTIGDTTLTPGTILVTLQKDESGVGSNNLSTKKQDIFYLDVTGTEFGSGTSATATMLLEGADVGLDTDAEDLRGVSVAPTL